MGFHANKKTKGAKVKILRASGVTHTPTFQETKSHTQPAIYIRVSTSNQDDSMESQLTSCHQLLQSHFPDIDPKTVRIFEEVNNLETYDKDDEIWKLLAEAERGKIDVIVVKSDHRIFRSATPKGVAHVRAKIEQLIRETGTKIISLEGPWTLKLLSNMGEKYRVEAGSQLKISITMGTQNGTKSKLLNRTYIHPAPPYGYRIKETSERIGTRYVRSKAWVLCKPEADVVEDILRVCSHLPPIHLKPFNRGIVTVNSIAAWLNDQPEKTARNAYIDWRRMGRAGYGWHGDLVRALLRRTAYYGKIAVCYGDTEWWKGLELGRIEAVLDVPAIVTEEIWIEAQAIAMHRETMTRKGTLYAPLHLLLKCHCGQSMAFNKKAGKYRCQGRRLAGQTHDEVNGVFADHVFKHAFNSKAFLDGIVNELEEIQIVTANEKEVARLKQDTAKLESDLAYIVGMMTKKSNQKLLPYFEKEAEGVRCQIEALADRYDTLVHTEDRQALELDLIRKLKRLKDQNGAEDELFGFLSQSIIKGIVVKPAPPITAGSRDDALELYQLGGISAEDAGRYAGLESKTVRNLCSEKRHPAAKHLHSTNVTFEISLRNGGSEVINGVDLLRETYITAFADPSSVRADIGNAKVQTRKSKKSLKVV